MALNFLIARATDGIYHIMRKSPSLLDKERIVDLLQQRKALTDFLFQRKEELARVHSSRRIDSAAWPVELADLLTLTAYAPSSWAPSRLLHEFGGHPPAPQFEQMRAGKLESLFKSSRPMHAALGYMQAEAVRSADSGVGTSVEGVGREGIELYLKKGKVVDNEDEDEDEEEDEENEENEEEEENEENEEEEDGRPRKRRAVSSGSANAGDALPGAAVLFASAHILEISRSDALAEQEAERERERKEKEKGATRKIEMSFGGDSSDDDVDEEEEEKGEGQGE